MLLITLSGGLSMMHVSSLMVSYTHWLSTSLVSIVFPVYIMSIAYWRAQASSADHWHRLCSMVLSGLLVISSSVGALQLPKCSLCVHAHWLFCTLCNQLVPCVCCVYQWYVRLRAYGLLATCRELLGSFWGLSLGSFWGAYWGTSLGSFLGNALGTYKLWETNSPWRLLRCSVYKFVVEAPCLSGSHPILL